MKKRLKNKVERKHKYAETKQKVKYWVKQYIDICNRLHVQ